MRKPTSLFELHQLYNKHSCQPIASLISNDGSMVTTVGICACHGALAISETVDFGMSPGSLQPPVASAGAHRDWRRSVAQVIKYNAGMRQVWRTVPRCKTDRPTRIKKWINTKPQLLTI